MMREKQGLIERLMRVGIRMELEKHGEGLFKNAFKHFSTN
jgi:hypothetical protein